MSSTPTLLSLLIANFIFTTLSQNDTRNYTIGIQVSSIWYSGSADDFYIQICNSAKATSNTTGCLEWYLQEGMENRKEWYEYTYVNQPNIGTPNSLQLVTYSNDQLCIQKVRIDGTSYEPSGSVSFQCIEVSDSKPSGSCNVMTIDSFSSSDNTASFTSELYDTSESCSEAGIDTTNAITPPEPKPINGTRTFELGLTVSSYSFSGTKDTLYLRLCTDEAREDCTQECDTYAPDYTGCEDKWFAFEDGVNEEGNTYKGYWNVKEMGNAKYADIVTFGSDQFCLSRLQVDDVTANAGNLPECISDDTTDGCEALRIDLDNSEFSTQGFDVCGFGIVNNNTEIVVDEYEFEFKTGSIPGCGADESVYFIICSADGSVSNNRSCSEIYELGGSLPDTGKTYSYDFSIEDYGMFNTLDDINFVDIFYYATDSWCLSDLNINGITEDGEELAGYNTDFGTLNEYFDSPVDEGDGQYCDGVRVYPKTGVYEEWLDGNTGSSYSRKKCRWTAVLDQYGTIKLSKMTTETNILEWMETGNNWIYICLVLIGIVICCICSCAAFQQYRKKHMEDNVEDSNKPWHGGNSAFYS